MVDHSSGIRTAPPALTMMVTGLPSAKKPAKDDGSDDGDPYAGFHDGPDDTRFVVFQINKDWYWQCMGSHTNSVLIRLPSAPTMARWKR